MAPTWKTLWDLVDEMNLRIEKEKKDLAKEEAGIEKIYQWSDCRYFQPLDVIGKSVVLTHENEIAGDETYTTVIDFFRNMYGHIWKDDTDKVRLCELDGLLFHRKERGLIVIDTKVKLTQKNLQTANENINAFETFLLSLPTITLNRSKAASAFNFHVNMFRDPDVFGTEYPPKILRKYLITDNWEKTEHFNGKKEARDCGWILVCPNQNKKKDKKEEEEEKEEEDDDCKVCFD